MGLLKAEICKLFYDKKIKVIFFLVTLYLLHQFTSFISGILVV